jgi:hypothetical protein
MYFKGSHRGKNVFIYDGCSFYEKYAMAAEIEVLTAVVMKSYTFFDIVTLLWWLPYRCSFYIYRVRVYVLGGSVVT